VRILSYKRQREAEMDYERGMEAGRRYKQWKKGYNEYKENEEIESKVIFEFLIVSAVIGVFIMQSFNLHWAWSVGITVLLTFMFAILIKMFPLTVSIIMTIVWGGFAFFLINYLEDIFSFNLNWIWTTIIIVFVSLASFGYHITAAEHE
jgi:hypothetical protein